MAKAYPMMSVLPFVRSENFFANSSLAFTSFLFSSESCRLEAELFAVTSTVMLADIFFCAFATSFQTAVCEPLTGGGAAPDPDPEPIPDPVPDPDPDPDPEFESDTVP